MDETTKLVAPEGASSSTTKVPYLATPRAIATAHAGEVIQGAIRCADGVHRLLYSLPAPTLVKKAELRITPGWRPQDFYDKQYWTPTI